MGTALVHSLAATEKRGVFRSWTVLLAIFAFSLSLCWAPFLVRSRRAHQRPRFRG